MEELSENVYSFLNNNSINQVDKIGLCVCCPKLTAPRTGWLTIDVSCKGERIWVIDENGKPAAGGVSGVKTEADGFVIDGDTYKIDGATCVTLSCGGSTFKIATCVNKTAELIHGSKDPYIVASGTFGGPPKEPAAGTTAPPTT